MGSVVDSSGELGRSRFGMGSAIESSGELGRTRFGMGSAVESSGELGRSRFGMGSTVESSGELGRVRLGMLSVMDSSGELVPSKFGSNRYSSFHTTRNFSWTSRKSSKRSAGGSEGVLDKLSRSMSMGSRGSFSKSRNLEPDDEEALIWAAVENLPMYERMRTTILENIVKGGLVYREQVDLRTLGQERLRTELVAKLFNESTGSEDATLNFLCRLRERIDRAGISLPTIEVRYENLSIQANTHIGRRALPTLVNATVDAAEGFLGAVGLNFGKRTKINVLRKVSGIIKPGRMTLLLGPPSSGKTTLLLALAGKLDSSLKFEGVVTYNGHTLSEFVPQKTSAYISQDDLHVGEMTVRETLEYAAKCQYVGEQRYDLLTKLAEREQELGIHPEADIDYYMKAAAMKETSSGLVADCVLKILGLDICADTIVGDEMRRGISGGQKKRVTTGEMIVGPMKTLFMDSISTGLDSSTTFQIVKYLRDIAHKLKSTIVVSLLQPAPETYELFDDVILLAEGQIVFHGPRDEILHFFEACGFKCPERKGIADFLQEVTSWKDQEQYWADKSQPYEFVTVAMFAEAFQTFHVGSKMAKELTTPFDKTECHDSALTFERYSISALELLKINFDKEWLLMKRNSFIYIFKTAQIAIMGFVAMLIFFRTQMHRNTMEDAQVYAGSLFFGLLNIMFNGYAELSLTIVRLPVFYKQRDMLFFPSWSFSLASLILSIPISIIETCTWVALTYYTVGYAPEASRFFKQLFLYFWVHQMSSSLFRLIAGASRTIVLSNTGGTFFLLAVFVMGGYLIQRKAIKTWWIWGYWASPMSYAVNGANVLEFLSPVWNKRLGISSDPLGLLYLKSVSIFPRGYWYWIAVFALIGYTVLFNVLFTLSLTYLGSTGKGRAAISEEQGSRAAAGVTSNPSSSSVAPSTRRSSPLSGFKSTISKSLHPRDIDKGDGGDVPLPSRNIPVCDWEAMDSSLLGSKNMVNLQSSNATGTGVEDAKAMGTKRGMILPFKPFAISFNNVNYYVDMPAEMRTQESDCRLQLLKGITGAFRPGVLTALMGVSGAGKTTLMDVLAGRKTGGYIEGDIRINGFPKNQATFARISGYCEQNDVHSPQLTVHESLMYSAWLRLSQAADCAAKTQFVQEVTELVELTPVKDALVGLPGLSGLSTEQRKRLTIAVELVANPSIIFMDEPTSGLDARAAAIVMRTVRNTVDTGRTVVCTIHQPSIDIFDSFDELLLLKRGGQVIYSGPLGRHAYKVVEYFEGVQGVQKIKEGYNPATWMLEVSSVAVEHHLNVDFADVYKKSSLFQRNHLLVEQLSEPDSNAKDLWFPSKYSQPLWSQFTSCLWKQNLTYWRSPSYNNVRIVFIVLVGVFFGSVFWQIGKTRGSPFSILSIVGAVVAGVIFTGINNAGTVQPVVYTERTVFYREKAAGMYSTGPYAIAQVLIEIPYCLVLAIIYSVITYAMIGLEWTAVKFFWYLYFMFFSYLYFTFYGMMTMGLTPNYEIAAVVASFFYQIWNIFSGYLIPRKRIPKWISWYYWANPVAWSLYGIVVTQLGNVDTLLDDGSESIKAFVDQYLGFKYSLLPVIAGMHIFFAVLFAFVFMLSIKYLNFQSR